MSKKQNSRQRDISQQLSVGYYTPSGEHDVDPTEDIQFLLNDNSRLRKAIEEAPCQENCTKSLAKTIPHFRGEKGDCKICIWRRNALEGGE